MTTALLNNRYRILRTIGRGGFGETFLAEDTHMPSGRRCVIKQLKLATDDPQSFQIAQQRFQREAAILEHLGDGNALIPKLYAYFSEAGQFYLVEEWIEGQTLTNKVQQQGPLPETSVREILLNLLPVLDFVHSRRIVHRDIKPDNIILRQRDGLPVLIDFGAVKEALGTVINYAANSPPSIMIGTPGFIPPEQAAGQPLYASDIYALGLTAIYLLTEKFPQELETDPQTGDTIWHQHAVKVSPNLAEILNKAIKSHPRDRFSSAGEMLNALQATATPNSQYITAPAANSNLSAMATRAVSPAVGQHSASSSPQTMPINTTANAPAVIGTQGQQPKPWLIGILVAGGLVFVTLALNALLRKEPTPSPIASSSPPVAEQPTPAETLTPELQTPTETQSPSVSTSPSQETASNPVPESTQTSTPAATRSPIISGQVTPNSAPIPVESSSPAITRTDKSALARSPEPLFRGNQSQNSNSSLNVPAFPVGTTRDTIQAQLGKPNVDDRGYYPATRAVSYKIVPNQIELGYLFDRNSGILRQTEVAFGDSVNSQVMQTTLDQLLKGSSTNDIKQGLEQVQQRQTDHYYFTNGAYKGMIVRQDCGLIYISVWDRDLHNHESVSSNKKC